MENNSAISGRNRAPIVVAITVAAVLAACAPRTTQVESAGDVDPMPAMGMTHQSAASIVASWPAKPREAAMMLVSKYGEPSAKDDMMLVWTDKRPYSKIVLLRDEQTHLFPMPHTDFLSHTVKVSVPTDKLDELGEFDGSLWYHRTRGELVAQCDLEAHNNIALNLGYDIAMGKRTVMEGRAEYARLAMAYKNGDRSDPYLMTIIFQPMQNAGDPDQPFKM